MDGRPVHLEGKPSTIFNDFRWPKSSTQKYRKFPFQMDAFPNPSFLRGFSLARFLDKNVDEISVFRNQRFSCNLKIKKTRQIPFQMRASPSTSFAHLRGLSLQAKKHYRNSEFSPRGKMIFARGSIFSSPRSTLSTGGFHPKPSTTSRRVGAKLCTRVRVLSNIPKSDPLVRCVTAATTPPWTPPLL